MEAIISTRNPSKLVQIRALVADSPITLLTLDDVGIEGSAPEDTSDAATLLGNAELKARFAWDRSDKKRWVLADDTGLFNRGLQGEPGVNAAVWGGAELSTEERMQHCLSRLSGIRDRRAKFRTIVFAISPDGYTHVFDGAVEGKCSSNRACLRNRRCPIAASSYQMARIRAGRKCPPNGKMNFPTGE